MAEGIQRVRQARDRTLESRTARFEFQTQFRLPDLADHPSPDRRDLLEALARAVLAAVGKVVSTALRLLFRRAHSAEGVINFADRRFMMDYGGFTVLVAEGRQWSGPSGRAVATLPTMPSACSPLWLLDLLQGVSEAQLEGSETLDGRKCRRFAGQADFTRAAEASPDDLALPPAKSYGELVAVPFRVWIDEEGLIRRLSLQNDMAGFTLDLLEYGVELPADWSRLPSFRSSAEA